MTVSELDGLTAYLTRRAGLSVAGSRGAWLREGVARAVGELGACSAEALHAVAGDDMLFARLCDEVTVQESFFFRERRSLALVRDVVLPGHEPGHPLAVWSAGCAGGEEAYTLAVLLADARRAGTARVLATDISAAAVASARRAMYSRWSLRGVEDEMVARCFSLRRGGWRVREQFRAMVTVEQHNLLDPPAKGGFDVILCRNVLIYLTPSAVRRVATHLAGALAPGGWLLTSASDPILEQVPGLETVHTDHGVAYRRPVSGGAQADGTTTHGRAGTARSVLATTAASAAAVDEAAQRRRRQRRTDDSRTDDSRTDRARSSARPRERGSEIAAAERALELGNPARAERAARLVLAGGPDVEAQRLLVRALGEQYALDDAVAEAEQGTATFPLDADLRHLHAVVLLETGRHAEAAAAARQAVYLAPDSPAGHLVLARCHEVLGDPAAAGRGRRNARRLIESGTPA